MSYEDFLSNTVDCEESLEKCKSLAIFKKAALDVEDTKFDDTMNQIIEEMITKRNQTANTSFYSRSTRRILKNEAKFKEVLYKAAKEVIYHDNHMFDKNVQHFADYINALIPNKNLQKLEEIKGQIQEKQHDIASLLKEQEDNNQEIVYGTFLDEPEPEILVDEDKKTEDLHPASSTFKKSEFEFGTSEIREKKVSEGNQNS